MSNRTYQITVRRNIPASPSQVWSTWSDPEKYCAVHQAHRAEIDFRPGGKNTVLFWEGKDAGEVFIYEQIKEESKLVFAWEGYPEHRVSVRIKPSGSGTRLAITQDCREDPEWINNCLDGWAWIIDSMAMYFETGEGIANEDWSRQFGGYQVVKPED